MLKFFWHQPRFRSDLDSLLTRTGLENPLLAAQKEAALKAVQVKEPPSWAVFFRKEQQDTGLAFSYENARHQHGQTAEKII